jgi:GNAT superfamily N-acetyltransferase
VSVAEADGALVGVLVLDDDWIYQLYILPTHTGRGLGAELVHLAKEHRPQRLRLWTFQANQRERPSPVAVGVETGQGSF